jgi:hypothetical protein
MLEIAFLASLSGIIGLLVRAAMKKESARFCLYHSLIIGTLLGIYAYYHTFAMYATSIFMLTASQYIQTSIVFAVFGYVASDVLESLTYVVRHPYNPLKMFAAIVRSLRREQTGRKRPRGKKK